MIQRTQKTTAHPPRVESSEFRSLQRRLGLALLALFLVTGVGVVGFMIIGAGEHDFVDAVYMTVITLTTVGFGEIIDMSANPAGRIFTILLLIGGMGIVAYTVTLLAAFVIEGQLGHIFSRRRMNRRVRRMEGHYIVCGDTAAAWYITEELVRTGRNVVLVAPDEAGLEAGRRGLGDVPGFAGDPSDDSVFEEAGVQRSAGVFFCMESDKDNLLGVLTAHRLSPRVRIVAGSELPETTAKLRSAGAQAVVSPSRIGGLRMASEMVRPTVVTFLDQMLREKDSSLRVEEVVVPETTSDGTNTIGSLRVAEIPGAILLAVRHAGAAGFRFKPSEELVLEPGMTLVVMTDTSGRELLEERLRG